ncbi:hypothetical protein L6164_005215 [Bauhinia variegata]|uniref:Uncharacterized protein n=1 Tax=Bauhinia variegata TaxID=167791 RepID=A0ACB9PPV4_BAUVA|nr:hypothetical protein L6164_005215 [Bauhinia variegata]
MLPTIFILSSLLRRGTTLFGATVISVKGKRLGLYFSASWCGPCRRFTPTLVEVYNEVSPKGDFEIIYISRDKDADSFNMYFSKMPWLAVPFSDSETRNALLKFFKPRGIPHLVIVDENGKVITRNGVQIISEHDVEGYPFSPERIQELKEQVEEAKRNQSLRSILVSPSRDLVISSDDNKVAVSELDGKTVGLYISLSSFKSCIDFTPKLADLYKELKVKGESFEIVMIPLDDDEESFKQGFKRMPWLSLPFKDKSCRKLAQYFELSALPTLVIIGPDGKTLHSNVVEAIRDHGIVAYPFTPEKFAELAEIEKARDAAQTLESILVSGDQDYVIGKEGIKIPVSDLVGKTILLYFSAHWCPPCRAFLPILTDAYHKIKEKDDAFEVIFISSDKNQASFDEYFAGMPWLALPFDDWRKGFLFRKFKVKSFPMLVAIGPSGRTVTTEARDHISLLGADAYPFTDDKLKEIEANCEEMAKGWPWKLTLSAHNHKLVLTRRNFYTCDGCDKVGTFWSYCCSECDFDLHPDCALDLEEKRKKNDSKDDWVCEGEVCRKA